MTEEKIARMFVDDEEMLNYIEAKKKDGMSQKQAWEEYEKIRREYGATTNRFKTIQSFNMWKSRRKNT
jgi:hypothetical protein